MVRTFLKVYMELGSSFLFLQEQIKDIIIMNCSCMIEYCSMYVASMNMHNCVLQQACYVWQDAIAYYNIHVVSAHHSIHVI
jgi:hypothetical protein